MSHDLLQDPRLPALLTHIDHEFVRLVRSEGCPCGGRLNVGNYPRKPRGPAGFEGDDAWHMRLSLCCAVEGCRRRATPPSVRFLGRKVYIAVVVTLACVVKGTRFKEHAQTLRETLGVSERTVRRWLSWWRRTFVVTALWVAKRGLLSPAPADCELPGSLLAAFQGSAHDALISFLKFISPVTTQSVQAM